MTESVVSFHGPVLVSGSVGKDVVVFDGLLTMTAEARVGGNVFAQRPSINSQATVSGSVYSIAALWRTADWLGWVGAVVLWLSIAVSVLVLGFVLLWVAPRAADATFVAGRTATGASIAWGLAVFVGLPILGVVAIATVLGLPLGLGILFGLVLLLAIGQTAGAWFLGRIIVHEPTGRIPAFLAGWAILSAISLIPGVGALVWFGSTVFGLGAMSVAMWRARHGGPVEVAPAPPMPVATPAHV